MMKRRAPLGGGSSPSHQQKSSSSSAPLLPTTTTTRYHSNGYSYAAPSSGLFASSSANGNGSPRKQQHRRVQQQHTGKQPGGTGSTWRAIGTFLLLFAAGLLIFFWYLRAPSPGRTGRAAGGRGNARGSGFAGRAPSSSSAAAGQYYYPRLLLPQSAGAGGDGAQRKLVETARKAWTVAGGSAAGEGPPVLVHIVHTRFMQDQGNLTALGNARLALFRVFCLPSIAQQTNQNFVWIIKVDVHLDQSIFDELLELVSPYDNVYVVKSNMNFRINRYHPGAWRGGAEPAELSTAPVYTGDRSKLEFAMALSRDPAAVILETRLDADDGLHRRYVEALQRTAMDRFFPDVDTENHGADGGGGGGGGGSGDNEATSAAAAAKWTYWCIPRNLEWHWVERTSDDGKALLPSSNEDQEEDPSAGSIGSDRYGALAATRMEDLCITAGITVGFGRGVEETDVPIFAHDRIVVNLKTWDNITCGLSRASECLHFVNDFVFGAVRSRTPTSAGMWNVMLPANYDPSPSGLYNYALWDRLHADFGLSRQQLAWMNRYLSDHLLDIAIDNLAGQCTKGHSCKDKARKSLEALIAARRRNATKATQ